MRDGRLGYRPNVGKSSLLNAILGQKLAATTHKPQTTQRRFQGVLTEGNQQIVFVDTPGLHEAKKGLHVFMVDEALSALKDVDLVVFVVEVAPPKNPRGRSPANGHPKDLETLRRCSSIGRTSQSPLVINKIDRLPAKEALCPS